MRDNRFQGLFIPHVTPMDESGALDRDSLERLAEHFVAVPDVAGLVSCARIGEGTVLSPAEKREVFKITSEVCRRAKRLHVAAITPQSTEEAIHLVRETESLPVDAVMIFPPLLLAWGKVGGDLKVKFFEDVARAAALPLVLFQVPVASYWYDAETVCRIADIEKVAAYKEASFNITLFSETLRQLELRRSMMSVLTGNDRFVAESYMLGAKGALIGVANLATPHWGALDAAGRGGDFKRAMALQEELRELKELVFGEPIVEAVSRIKVILRHEGLIQKAHVRRPQLGVGAEEERRLISAYGKIVERASITH